MKASVLFCIIAAVLHYHARAHATQQLAVRQSSPADQWRIPIHSTFNAVNQDDSVNDLEVNDDIAVIDQATSVDVAAVPSSQHSTAFINSTPRSQRILSLFHVCQQYQQQINAPQRRFHQLCLRLMRKMRHFSNTAQFYDVANVNSGNEAEELEFDRPDEQLSAVNAVNDDADTNLDDDDDDNSIDAYGADNVADVNGIFGDIGRHIRWDFTRSVATGIENVFLFPFRKLRRTPTYGGRDFMSRY